MNPAEQPDLSNALVAAQSLLGWKLIHETSAGRTAGIIVETEAYTHNDPASHTFRGPRIANAPMFAAAGTIYVYFTYGMHYCVNIVTGAMGQGEAVLIRALEPVEGIDLMRRRRGVTAVEQLCSGPAKLVQAMGITRDLSGQRLQTGQLWLEPGIKVGEIAATPRIGIRQAVNQPWRFVVRGNRFVSRPVI